MTRFKVGDIVKTLYPPDYNRELSQVTGIIIEIDFPGELPYLVRFDKDYGQEWWCEEDCLKLINTQPLENV